MASSGTPPHSTTISVKSPIVSENNKDGIVTSLGGGEVKHHGLVDMVLRVMLFTTSLIGIIVMVTSKQTKMIPVAPGVAIPLAANFNQSPSFIYYVVALSVACLYSISTGMLSIILLLNPKGSSTSTSTQLLVYFVALDALVLGMMASATGAAGAVAYIGYKGNSHTRWNEVCNIYDSFCAHVAGSISLSVLPSVALLLLIWLSVFVLSKKIIS